MFERAHHRRIAAVLAQLDGERLRELSCLFGGGTAIALRCGEYRETVDLDFLVADADGDQDDRSWGASPPIIRQAMSRVLRSRAVSPT